MTNLKRVLSLALAAVMLMGMMVIGAGAKDAADFDDYNEVQYTEAMDVMIGLKIIDGDDQGQLNPAGNLTREQAAKIICYLLMGKEGADLLSAEAAPFADVAATRWSAGYIAYCKSEGIISGIGNNKFNPTGNVTAAEFAKMLLGALGYESKNEGFTGTQWSINVTKTAQKAGLFEGDSSVAANLPLTREEACLYALNTLTADMVEYSGGVDVSTGGTTVTVGAVRDEVTNTQANDYRSSGGDTTMQFCEQYFAKLEKDVDGAVTDDFGRPGYTWKYDNQAICFAGEDAVAVFTASTSSADVAKALSGYKFVDNASATTTYKIEDNTKRTETVKVDVVVKNTTTGSAQTTRDLANETTAAEIAGITDNGRLVEIYANDKDVITKIVVVDYKVVEAGKVTTDSKTGDVSYVIDGVTYKDFADEDADDQIVLAGTVAKDDIVTYTKAGGKVYVYPTTSFEGTQTATKTKDGVQTITIDGSAYIVGKYTLTGKNTFKNSKDAATYYVDQYGFVVATDSKSVASTDYAMVTAVEAKIDTDFDAKTPSVQARVVLADGTVGVYTVALTKNDAGDYYITNIGGDSNVVYTSGNTADNVKTAAAGDIKNGVFGYTLDGNTITLEPLTALPANATATAENTVYSAAVGAASDYIANNNTSYTVNTDKTVLVNSSTVFVAFNSTKNTATVYTGVSSLPSTVPASQTGIAVLKTGTTSNVGTASVVFFTITSALSADSTDDLVYVDGTYSTVMVDGKDKYVYTGYKADGTTVELYGATASQAAGLYIPNKDNEISGAPKTNSYSKLIIDSAKLTVEGSMVKSGTNWYYITSETQIVYVNSDLNEVNDNTGVMILVKDSSNVDVIYVTAD